MDVLFPLIPKQVPSSGVTGGGAGGRVPPPRLSIGNLATNFGNKSVKLRQRKKVKTMGNVEENEEKWKEEEG